MLLSFLTIYTHKKETGYFVLFCCRFTVENRSRKNHNNITHTQKKEELLKCLHSQGGARNLPCKSSTDKLLAICERINQHLFFFFLTPALHTSTTGSLCRWSSSLFFFQVFLVLLFEWIWGFGGFSIFRVCGRLPSGCNRLFPFHFYLLFVCFFQQKRKRNKKIYFLFISWLYGVTFPTR